MAARAPATGWSPT